MNAMKTTINDWKMAPAKSAQKHDSCVNFKSCATEKSDSLCGARLQSSGRPVRQIVITNGDMNHASKAQRRAALRRLVKAARKWFKAYDPVVRWVAVSTNFGMEQRSNDYAAATAANNRTGEIIP